MLATARLVLAAAMKPNRPFSVGEIALETGLTVEGLRRILNSRAYQAVMTEQLQMLVGTTITRSVAVMDKIITSEDSTDLNKIAATRAVVHVYQAITAATRDDTDPNKVTDASVKSMLAALKQLSDKRKEQTT